MSDQIILNSEHCSIEIAERAGCYWDTRTCTSIARVKDNELLGGVIFSGFTGESIGIHSASWGDHWMNRDLLWITFDYPFRQLRVQRIFGQVPESNWAARKFNENLGFRYVNRIEGVFRGNEACLLMCMERHECRFLRIKPRNIKSNLIEA